MIVDEDLELEMKNRLTNVQSEVTFKKEENKVATTSEQTNDLVEQGIKAAVMHKLKMEEEVQDKFLSTAEKIIDTNISKATNEAEKDEKAAVYENNKDACDLFGINETTVPKWVVKLCVAVQNFWYAVWILVGFFSIAPIVFVSKKIKIIVKLTWVAVLLAILLYAAIATSPLWLQYLQF